jgi:hypothetical protein
LRRAEGGAKIVGVLRVKNHDFTPKNHIFSNLRGGLLMTFNDKKHCHKIVIYDITLFFLFLIIKLFSPYGEYLLNKINNKKKTSLLSDVSDSISVLILQ